MSLFIRQLPKLMSWAAVLLIIVQPLLAADCPCCYDKGADEAGSATERVTAPRQSCAGRCCGAKTAKACQAHERRPASADQEQLAPSPCDCPEDCLCQVRHDSLIVVDRVAQSNDIDSSVDVACWTDASPPVQTSAVLAPSTSEVPSSLFRSAAELCALICRLTI